MGSAVVEPAGEFEAGSYQSFTLTYSAGFFGIDDTGSIKIVHRFASDMGRPQFDRPSAANFVTAEASNGAVLYLEYDMKRNIRPWDKTLYIKVVRGFLQEGDTITVRFGDTRQGGPGMRVQTFCEDTFEFRVLVDAIATYNYVELPVQPHIKIVPGVPVRFKAILPTHRCLEDSFRLCLKGEDKWGNPSDLCDRTITLKPSLAVQGIPNTVTFHKGEIGQVVEHLECMETGILRIEMVDSDGDVVAVSNPMKVSENISLRPFWADLHGQSEETIGTNSARDFHEFARDSAFLDAVAHQGNDFQITTKFWNHLNDLTREFNSDGEFIAFPGYEWSGNTGLGGDRNVLYRNEGEAIHRSSHALVHDLSDIESDANSAAELFRILQNRECVVFAHIGGRYADINIAHDIRLERSVEVHSAWGTFEWLLEDALKQGYRVGIVSNSDGHKGRPGASHPGATKFGAYGGLTCMLATEHSRDGLLDALARRHHYGTTGCRVHLSTHAAFSNPAKHYSEDPAIGNVDFVETSIAMMGDILGSRGRQVEFKIEYHGSAPIERIEIRNSLDTIEIFRPYENETIGNRIRIIWEGSEYRGRGRETVWDGSATLSENSFTDFHPINRYNLDKKFDQTNSNQIEWQALTTGGFGGVDAILEFADRGILAINTKLVNVEIPVKDIGLEDIIFDAGGINRRIRVFRLPDTNSCHEAILSREIKIDPQRDNALYVCITQEDGHLIWSSPIYVIPE
jgi:hypothetical protein